jgi:1L-myo-inositol 1-phosphate cytidylyltransferase
MITEAVLLAAGMGTRLRQHDSDPPKPLTVIGGRTLIGHALDAVRAAGVTRVGVVIGFRSDVVRAAVEADPAARGLDVHFIVNDEYEKSIGISVAKAHGHVRGPFVLAMTDHLFDVELVRRAVAADMQAADLYLCVDRRLAEVHDLDDATLVRTDGDRLVDLDKGLADFDAVDCGVFVVDPILLEELRAARTSLGQPTLSDGVKRIAARGRARVIDIGDSFWIDVDTPDALVEAKRRLAQR